MNRKTVTILAATVGIAAFCLTGCGESKQAKQARLQGITQLKEGSYTEAITSFDTALKEADGVVNKFELDILKYRAEAEYCLEDYAAASHTYNILLEVDGQQPEYLYCKAAADAQLGDTNTAVTEYTTAAELDKTMNREVEGAEAALAAIGKAYAASGEYEQAMSFYQTVENSGNATAEIYNQMGLCLIEAKRYDDAISYFDQGVALGQEAMMKELTFNKGAAYEYKGDFAKALELFNSYVSTYGSTPELEKEIAFLQSR